MDLVLHIADQYLGLDKVYNFTYPLPRNNIYRQSSSLFFIWWIGGVLLYLIMGAVSYFLWFDKNTFNHPRFLRNQIKQEMAIAFKSLPLMSLYTVPWFVAELLGYSKLYDNPFAHGKLYFFLQFPFFILFTDFTIYLIHRGLHHPLVYKHIHKTHHKWIMTTPFASHAFHSVDGYLQSLPYHIFPFIFPLQKHAYVLLFLFVNVWTVMIHDGVYLANNPIINGSACHTLHHLYFNYNYGQFTTLWDRIGGSYRPPTKEEYDHIYMKNKNTLQGQLAEFSKMVNSVEGVDERLYNTTKTKSA